MLYTQNIHINFFKKYDREAREPAKEANTAWNRKLCYLINNYNTNIGNLTLSTYNLFGTQETILKWIKIEKAEHVSAKTREKR